MPTPRELDALRQSFLAAKASGHIFPQAAACESALETASQDSSNPVTGWFASALYRLANNLFGEKQHSTPIYGTIAIPTPEYLQGHWQTVPANWVKYPDLASSYRDRMATLQRCAAMHDPAHPGQLLYPHYAAALAATTPEEYVTQVSQTWSTGPQRAQVVIDILHAHANLFTEPA